VKALLKIAGLVLAEAILTTAALLFIGAIGVLAIGLAVSPR
jgi:hypothetical protein